MRITIVPPSGSDEPRKIPSWYKPFDFAKASSTPTASDSDRKEGTFEELTTKTVRPEVVVTREKDTAPIDLTRNVLMGMGIDSPVAQLVPALPRLRVVIVDEKGDLKNAKTIGAGSGTIISANGAILSVNHVSAVGAQGQSTGRTEFLPGTQVLKNLSTWQKLLGGERKAVLVADIPVLPKPDEPRTIFTPGNSGQGSSHYIGPKTYESKDHGRGATAYPKFYEGGIDYVTVPLRILAEDNQRDLMLAVIDLPDPKDPYTFAKITDQVPQFVYSVGHPLGIAHPALALGEVVCEDFSLKNVAEAFDAHMRIAAGIAAAAGVKGFTYEGIPQEVLTALSGKLAPFDIEPMANFFSHALITTNRIDHGSSGGYLGTPEREQTGVTYIGLPSMLNNTAIMRYLGGTFGFRAQELNMDALSGSISMKAKGIPFLEKNGFNVQRARDGEPIDLRYIARSHERSQARAAMRTFVAGQIKDTGGTITDEAVEERLREMGLEEETTHPTEKVASPDTNAQVSAPYYVTDYAGNKIELSSKPVQINRLQVAVAPPDEQTGNRARIALELDIQTEDGQVKEVRNFIVDPDNFSLETSLDPDTKTVVEKYLTENFDAVRELAAVQADVERINSGSGPDNDPPPLRLAI